jgi:hypothetical protein
VLVSLTVPSKTIFVGWLFFLFLSRLKSLAVKVPVPLLLKPVNVMSKFM